MAQLARKQKYDFIPSLVSVRVMCFYGNKQLAVAETKKLPISFSPRWYEWLSFNNLKLLNIPKEARLCFEIMLHSNSFDSQKGSKVLACASKNIFEPTGLFNSGV